MKSGLKTEEQCSQSQTDGHILGTNGNRSGRADTGITYIHSYVFTY